MSVAEFSGDTTWPKVLFFATLNTTHQFVSDLERGMLATESIALTLFICVAVGRFAKKIKKTEEGEWSHTGRHRQSPRFSRRFRER